MASPTVLLGTMSQMECRYDPHFINCICDTCCRITTICTPTVLRSRLSSRAASGQTRTCCRQSGQTTSRRCLHTQRRSVECFFVSLSLQSLSFSLVPYILINCVYLSVFLCLLHVLLTCHAQVHFGIKGRVTDARTQQGIVGATIQVCIRVCVCVRDRDSDEEDLL